MPEVPHILHAQLDLGVRLASRNFDGSNISPQSSIFCGQSRQAPGFGGVISFRLPDGPKSRPGKGDSFLDYLEPRHQSRATP